MSTYAPPRPRPLRSLSKTQLFVYPKANPTREAQLEFTRELLLRLGVASSIERKLDGARVFFERAQQRLAGSSDVSRASLQAEADRARIALEVAKQEVASLGTNDRALTQKEINLHYKSIFASDLQPMVDRWIAGTLFKAQAYGFRDFLAAEGRDQKADDRTYWKFVRLLEACDEQKGPIAMSAWALYSLRIFPPLSRRRAFTDEAGGETNIEAFDQGLKQKYWRWLRDYNRATIKFGWQGDFIEEARIPQEAQRYLDDDQDEAGLFGTGA